MWAVEKDPALRSDFCNLTILDGPPDPERLRARIVKALEVIPRLRQRVVTPPLRLAPPEWVDDLDLDLDYHLRHVAAPAPGTVRQLLDLVEGLAETPFDRSRPLWEFTLVSGLEGGRTALLQKLHHTITDGVGGLRLSLSLVETEPTPSPAGVTDALRTELHEEALAAARANPLRRPSPLAVVGGALAHTVANQTALARRGIAGAVHLVAHPTAAPRYASDAARLAASLRRQLLVAGRGRSPLLTERSATRHFEVLAVPLPAAKAAARMLGGTLNDLFVTAVAGALGAYHDRMGAPCESLRMGMAVNVREHGDRAPNRFGPVRVVVPTVPKDPVARFDLVRARLATTRHEPALGLVEELAGLLGILPTSVLVDLTRAQARTLDFVTSNLRGSPVPLYLAGRRIEGSFPFGPRTASALNVTLFSYADELQVGLNVDPAAFTDPGLLVGVLSESFDALLAVAG